MAQSKEIIQEATKMKNSLFKPHIEKLNKEHFENPMFFRRLYR